MEKNRYLDVFKCKQFKSYLLVTFCLEIRISKKGELSLNYMIE